MKFIYLLAVSIGLHTYATAQDKVPFDGMDLSWMNGQNRQKDFPLVVKDKENNTIITGVALFDTYINYDFSNPIDHTHNASATIGRNNEFTVNMASIGLEANYKNVIGRIYLQSGAMLNLMQDQDASVLRGNNNAISNLKNIREAAAGYHFNKWYGVNIEVGILPSFIGTESYNTQENWCYQRAMISEFTPYYFSGARLQVFPSKNFKTELLTLFFNKKIDKKAFHENINMSVKGHEAIEYKLTSVDESMFKLKDNRKEYIGSIDRLSEDLTKLT